MVATPLGKANGRLVLIRICKILRMSVMTHNPSEFVKVGNFHYESYLIIFRLFIKV